MAQRVGGVMTLVSFIVGPPVAEAGIAPSSGVTYAIRDTAIVVSRPGGVQLWGCLIMPVTSSPAEHFPALLISDPYQSNCTRMRRGFGEFAKHGYVVAYFHVRGTGHSTGQFPPREYSDQELGDEVALVDWLAHQPWSTGRVGMFGGSWSGFNSIQVAMRQPPALKAIVAYVATEDLYHEDGRFGDGMLQFNDYDIMADLWLIASMAPDNPMDETTLRNRFDQTPWSLVYLRQQRDGDFWRRRIRLDVNPDTLRVPIFMVGGWYDGYRTAILRALEHLRAPARAIIGPWLHGTGGEPPPAADVLRAVIRWWDYWLKDAPNGVLDDPQLVAYMRRPYRPRPHPGPIPGEWRAVSKWPPAGLTLRRFVLTADGRIDSVALTPASQALRYVPSGGIGAGIWWGDPAPDQRLADAYSLVYQSTPLITELQMLGSPTATLRTSTTAPRANWMVRLEDVAPDGTVTLITGAGINGAQRSLSVAPESLVPGEVYTLRVPLHFASWIFEPGHRIRLAVSNALWPMFWPSPYPMTTTLEVGSREASTFTLPVIPPQSPASAQVTAASIGSTNVLLPAATPQLDSEDTDRDDWIGPATTSRDEIAATTTVSYTLHYPELPGMAMQVAYSVHDTDPSQARTIGTCSDTVVTAGHTYVWQGRTEITSDRGIFHYSHHRELLRDGARMRDRWWQEDVPRDYQ